jgi:hypothetical protein
VVSVLTPAEILIAARQLAAARPHLAAVAGIVHQEDLWQLCRNELTGVDIRTGGWDIRGRWFGVVVGATPRLGELRRGEAVPWRVIAAQIAPRERRSSRWPDRVRLDRREYQSAGSPPRSWVLRIGPIQSIFGGTTEIQKEIIARGLGL